MGYKFREFLKKAGCIPVMRKGAEILFMLPGAGKRYPGGFRFDNQGKGTRYV
jgi:hypothetical protein